MPILNPESPLGKAPRAPKVEFKIHLIPYQHIYEYCMKKLIAFYDTSFIMETDQAYEKHYVLAQPLSQAKLKIELTRYIMDYCLIYCKPNVLKNLEQQYYIIIDSCYPFNNFRRSHVIPNKNAQNIVNNMLPIKYVLKDRKIKIDDIRINQIMESIFNQFFKNIKMIQEFIPNSDNIMFFKHNCITSNDLITLIREKILGKKITHISTDIKIKHTEDLNQLVYGQSTIELPEAIQNHLEEIFLVLFRDILSKKNNI